MKVNTTRKPVEPKFEPVKIELTLESDSEVAMFYAMFNVLGGNKVLCKHGLDPLAIRDAIKAAYPNVLGGSSPQFRNLVHAFKTEVY